MHFININTIRVIIFLGFIGIHTGFSSVGHAFSAESGAFYALVSRQQDITVKGRVVDETGAPLPGATIIIAGTTRGVLTDTDGSFTLKTKPEDQIDVSFVGYQTASIVVTEDAEIEIILVPLANELEEVTIVAFGKQKKESVISSIQTVNVKDLRVPSSNLTTAFAGRMAGVISYQTSGEPGQDNAEFFIRGITTFGTGKVDPLILIDNVEVTTNDLSRLHPDDIQSFSILKDATATALYGARGANGVVLITTKEGREGAAKVSFRFENSWSAPTQKIKMADPVTYMRLYNEAIRTRSVGAEQAPQAYSDEYIENTAANVNPYVFPAVDWMNMLTKSVTSNQRANLNISGGGKVARYYIAGSFTQDNGVLKVDKRNSFNNNIDLKKYLIRSNININLTSSTEAIIRIHGTFDDYNGPINGGSDMYKKMLQVSPVRFPAYFEPDRNYAHVNHILFGGTTVKYLNPYAELVKGYRQESTTLMLAQFELKQDFGRWIKGLTARLLGNTTRNSAFSLSRQYSPYYYHVVKYDRSNNEYFLRELNSEGAYAGEEALSYNPGRDRTATVSSAFYAEGAIAYSRTFRKKHDVSGMVVSILRNALTTNANTLAESLPKRNLGVSGRFTYGYDSRYFGEFNFGYNGSEKFDKGHRWGFFPSLGVGWSLSNESFWKNAGNLKKYVSKLRLRGTYGMVGNDEIGSERFFYISLVNLNGGGNYVTGYNVTGADKNRTGISISNYPNSDIGWEISYKSNLGIELGLLDGKIEILADLFREHRVNILQPRADVPSTMGLWSTPKINVGEANGKGTDISLDYNHSIGADAWITARANFTYARSEFAFYEEADYAAVDQPWRSRKGQAISQRWGYVAERLFLDDAEANGAARQEFGERRAGDIKFKDIYVDGVINDADKTPIGYPATPEINYGFGVSAGYKGLDFSFFFQGSGRSSFWISSRKMSPFIVSFINNDNSSADNETAIETGLAQFIADDHWSEANQNPYAAWPRLSTYHIVNNEINMDNDIRNTWFMRDGRFLRLKSAEIGYTLPHQFTRRWKIDRIRFYASGTNLWLFSKFKLWDVEMGNNGLGYPLQRVINAGINVAF
ncbi:MAG: TonB-dependent receptor [Bacteroidales bacterium]|jgi:TonB-linked SusC/RagA family outer membrane protein|nr:TonB-dependent receptor [Bacteroidales bacterium]